MNDLDTYEILVREHVQMLRSYLLAIVRDPPLAEELAQQTFVQAYKKLSTLKKEESFAAWLRRIARNLAVDELQRRWNEIPTDPEILQGIEEVFLGLEGSGEADSWGDRAAIVKACFEKLPEPLRQCCARHYFDDKKAREIAEELATSTAAVLKRLERGRVEVRKCVEKQLKLEAV